MAQITKWKCTAYGPDPKSDPQDWSSIPSILRCWSNQFYNGANCQINSRQNNKDTFESSYSCTSYRGTNYRPAQLSNYIPCSGDQISSISINKIRDAIFQEINERKKNPGYQLGQVSRVRSAYDCASTPIEQLPGNLSDMTSSDIAYLSSIYALEDYIKDADVEKQNGGTGPSLSTVEIDSTKPMDPHWFTQLSGIYVYTYKDCICYSDCTGYAVCYCYDHCNYY